MSTRSARCGKQIVYRHQKRRVRDLLVAWALHSEIILDKPTVCYWLVDPPGSTSAAPAPLRPRTLPGD